MGLILRNSRQPAGENAELHERYDEYRLILLKHAISFFDFIIIKLIRRNRWSSFRISMPHRVSIAFMLMDTKSSISADARRVEQVNFKIYLGKQP
jgi:hypothetical protein